MYSNHLCVKWTVVACMHFSPPCILRLNDSYNSLEIVSFNLPWFFFFQFSDRRSSITMNSQIGRWGFFLLTARALMPCHWRTCLSDRERLIAIYIKFIHDRRRAIFELIWVFLFAHVTITFFVVNFLAKTRQRQRFLARVKPCVYKAWRRVSLFSWTWVLPRHPFLS